MLNAASIEKADALAVAIRAILPDSVAVAVRPVAAPAPPLYPNEVAALARAVPKRRQEFAAARAAARTAMAALGQPAAGVPMQSDRAPQWPEGLIGSISHTDLLCVAAVASGQNLRAIGIDIEPDTHLPPDVLDAVSDQSERDWLAALPAPQQCLAARIIFSAKEAFFKAQYPITGTMIDFDAVQVSADIDKGVFTLRPRRQIDGLGARDMFHGAFVRAAGHIACALTLGHAD